MNKNPNIKDPLISKNKAIQAAGNAASVAKLLGISRASVSGWGEYVPNVQAYRVKQIFPDLDN